EVGGVEGAAGGDDLGFDAGLAFGAAAGAAMGAAMGAAIGAGFGVSLVQSRALAELDAGGAWPRAGAVEQQLHRQGIGLDLEVFAALLLCRAEQIARRAALAVAHRRRHECQAFRPEPLGSPKVR